MMASFLGTSLYSRASVELSTRSSDRSTPGRVEGVDPVAMMTLSAVMRSSPTCTDLSSLKVAVPW